MAGILDFLGQGNSPFAGWLDPRRQTLIGFGAGMIGQDSMRDAMRGAAQGAVQGHQIDTLTALDREQAAEQEAQENATRQWLQQNGQHDLLAALDGGVDVGTVFNEAWRRSQPAQAPDPTSAMQNYEYLIANGVPGPDAMERAFGGGGTTVNLQEFGTIPTGYRNVYDEQGRLVSQEPIPGGPAAVEAAQAETAAANANQNTANAASVVLEDIARAREIVQNDALWNPAVGLGSGLAQNVEGSNATNLRALTQTIRSNIGFDRLQAMREASPTGGALGNVTERELADLQAVLGSLDQAQSEDQFLHNLQRLEQIYGQILQKASAYPNAADFGFGSAGPTTGPAADPLGIR